MPHCLLFIVHCLCCRETHRQITALQNNGQWIMCNGQCASLSPLCLHPHSSLLFHREQRRHHLNAVPQILQPEILIGAVLVVVVVDNGYADGGRLEQVGED